MVPRTNAITLRPARLPDDLPAILELDTCFTSDRIYAVTSSLYAISLVEAASSITKCYELSREDFADVSSDRMVTVATTEASVIGVACAEYVEWNRRVELQHLYVDRNARGAGLGTTLLNNVILWAQTTPARCLWLETQNVNYPAICFYRKRGFEWCGSDLSLYDLQALNCIETALFFSLPLS